MQLSEYRSKGFAIRFDPEQIRKHENQNHFDKTIVKIMHEFCI